MKEFSAAEDECEEFDLWPITTVLLLDPGITVKHKYVNLHNCYSMTQEQEVTAGIMMTNFHLFLFVVS